ncbi:pantoate--beta-alanine ligase [Clostridium novyi A str. 4570]|uniref:Pantothenate synthetase n=1 Tax=Clostridium novyi A str. 4570 TaxID=1444290 RepID=A0AA88ZPM9_CLONO|nr:pantoate--beta-alanine ligase [Clostridium novyi]KGN02750.1 pantoate--beta-alanine ligase [Clostridium novyi A str. 4570]
MLKLNKINEVKKYVAEWKKEGLTIGLVPTMGCLHEGHKSLIDRAVKENDKVIVSVFVNPTQFGPNEDFDKYPRSIENDVDLCNKAGVSIVFNPEPKEMYFEDACTYVNVENLTDGLCGAKREGHFRGVCTVVSKLFNISEATRAYFGEKDAQQLAVIKRMVRDLNFNVEIVGCPIVRESDGLAKSSRNKYLSKEERVEALALSKGLKKGKELLENGIRKTSTIKETIENEIKKSPLSKIDYIEVVDSVTLEPVENIERDVLVAIAVFIGKTRLIDNFTFKLGE